MGFSDNGPDPSMKAGGGPGASRAMASRLAWKSRPVFLSSTFRDMHKDRDFLRARAFPEIEERLRHRGHYLETIDLRQGVETAGMESEEARELKVLKVCLDEIIRSRPFFVALLGDRYGWIPPAERINAASRAADFAVDAAGHSVTELEILRGVLNAPEQASRSWFYFREMDYSGMSPDRRRDYDERAAAENPQASPTERAAALERAAKLDSLKQRIRLQLPGRCRTYRVRWDSPQEGLNELARMVVADMWSDLDLETREYLRTAPKTEAEADLRELDDFVVERTRGFVERPPVTERMLRHVAGPASPGSAWALAVTGESGSGKSSLFGHIYRKLRDRDDLLLLGHAAGISVGAGQVDRMLRRFVGELAVFLGERDPIKEILDAPTERIGMEAGPSSPRPLSERVDELFAELLFRAAERTRVVVLIDALNQFENTVRAGYLTWLPKAWPENARFLATSIPGQATEALIGRTGAEAYNLPEVDRGEASEMARSFYAGRYHREVNTRVLTALLDKHLPDGRPAHGNPLWLALALQESNLLEADDYERADSEFGHLPPASRMEALQVREARSLPPDAPGVYGRLLERTERYNGREWTRAFVNAIGLSRSGWRESDLRALVPALSGRPWEDLAFAGVRRALGPHLVQRGAEAQWDFFHAQLGQAVLDRNMGNPEFRRSLHGAMADHLLGLPPSDTLRSAETVFHIVGQADGSRALRYLADLAPESVERESAAMTLATMIETGQRAGNDWDLSDWIGRLLHGVPATVEERTRAADFLIYSLDTLLQVSRTAEAPRGRILDSAREAMEAIVSVGQGHDQIILSLSACCIKLGDLNRGLGNSQKALEFFQKSSARLGDLRARNPQNADFARVLSVNCDKMGDLHLDLGEGRKALVFYQSAWAIAEDLRARNPRSAEFARDLSISCDRLGDLHLSLGNGQKALEFFQKSLDLREDLRVQNPQSADFARALAVSCERLGVLHLSLGNDRKALEFFKKSLDLREELRARDPQRADFARDLSVSHIKLGDLHLSLGDRQKALGFYQKALDIAEDLLARNPQSADFASDLSVSYNNLGNLHRRLGNDRKALEFFQKALDLREELRARDPQRADFARSLSVSYNKFGDLHRRLGNDRKALEFFQKALDLREELRARDPQSAEFARDLWLSYWRMASMAESTDPGSAGKWWKKAYDVLSGMKQRGLMISPEDEESLAMIRQKLLE